MFQNFKRANFIAKNNFSHWNAGDAARMHIWLQEHHWPANEFVDLFMRATERSQIVDYQSYGSFERFLISQFDWVKAHDVNALSILIDFLNKDKFKESDSDGLLQWLIKQYEGAIKSSTEIQSNSVGIDSAKSVNLENLSSSDPTAPKPLDISDVGTSNFFSHASRVALINFENREKLALEFHSFLKTEIDWSTVNRYRGSGGIDPNLGGIVLLIYIIILFQPLSIDEDSPLELQLSPEQKEMWSSDVLNKIITICSTFNISNIFMETDFDLGNEVEEDLDDEDYLFKDHVTRACWRIYNHYCLIINCMQQLGRVPN